MQIQTTIQIPGRNIAATRVEAVATRRPEISWQTFMHRRRLAKMHRGLMQHLALMEQATERA